MLNGAAAVGKTTIANRYAKEHPLTLNFAGDIFIEMVSEWRRNEEKARSYVFDMTTSIIDMYAQTGNDVVIQYLLTDARHAEVFSKIAAKYKIDFIEILLEIDKKTAVRRLLKRGVWGEVNSPKLTEADTPAIENLFDLMLTETKKRPNTVRIPVIEGDVEGVYSNFINAIK